MSIIRVVPEMSTFTYKLNQEGTPQYKGAGKLMASRLSHWQLLLREYLERNPEEKKRIANALNVSVRTVDRWIAGTTDPSRPLVPRLATVIPGKETEMRLSLEREYPSAFERASEQEIMSNVPSPFYARELESLAKLAGNVSRSTIRSSVLKQMGGHLDPDEEGILILFAQCVKPIDGGKVASLQVHALGYGTNKWQYQQVKEPYHIGGSSLCARAILSGEIALSPQPIGPSTIPEPLLCMGEICSCAAFPVFREGEVAGALFLAAAQPKFFTEARRGLIEQYSYSFALSLRDHEFYPMDHIDLQPMPSIPHQSEIYRLSQLFLIGLSAQFPDDTPEQLERRAREIFHQSEFGELANA